MVAVLIMMVGMVGLLQAIGVTLEHNLRNQLREEAVYLGEKYMNELRAKSFSNYSDSYGPLTVTGKVRGGGMIYTVERSAAPLSPDKLNRQLQVTVKWTFKKVQYQNRVQAPVSQTAN